MTDDKRRRTATYSKCPTASAAASSPLLFDFLASLRVLSFGSAVASTTTHKVVVQCLELEGEPMQCYLRNKGISGVTASKGHEK